MNETTFSRWLCKQLLKQGLFPQRLEVTTGAGVPDLAVLGFFDINYTTAWIELKWKTKHIRPEQYIWGLKAQKAGSNVNYVVGYEETFELYDINDAEKMTNTFKLTNRFREFSKDGEGVKDLLSSLR